MEKILSIDKSKIAVIVEYHAPNRKLIHQWLNSQESTYPHRSFSSPHYDRDYKIIKRFKRCSWCDTKLPILDENYREGYLKNNKDEGYWLECNECDESFVWEPNFDGYDDVKTHILNKNNMIVFGNYIKHCQKQNKLSDNEYDEKELIDYLKIKKVHIIDAPKEILSRKDFMEYIHKKIGS